MYTFFHFSSRCFYHHHFYNVSFFFISFFLFYSFFLLFSFFVFDFFFSHILYLHPLSLFLICFLLSLLTFFQKKIPCLHDCRVFFWKKCSGLSESFVLSVTSFPAENRHVGITVIRMRCLASCDAF